MTYSPLQLVIVDDFDEDRAVIRRTLRKGMERHFICHEASNGEEALQLHAQTATVMPAFDLMLLDLNLPDLNGLEVLQELQGGRASLPFPVVVLTGAPHEEAARAALAAGAQDFIAKSQITPETLTRTVLNAIERFRLVKALQASEERSRHQLAELQAAELAERTQRRLAEALLNSLTALTGSLDVESVMQQLLACAATVVPSDAGSVILYEGGVGRVAYLRGFGPEAADFFKAYRFPLPAVLQGNLATPAYPYLIADTATLPQWLSLPVTRWIRSSIRIPIELYGEVIGVLIADSATPNHFQPADLEKLQAFARYASLALEKADHITKLEAQVAKRTADLRAAKERVEALLENSLDGILLVHADLRIEQTNPAFHQLFAGRPEKYTDQTLLDLVPPAERTHVATVLQAAITAQEGKQLETRMQRTDGTLFDAELSIGYINQAGLVCSLRDITERKQAEAQLRKSETLYRLLAENITDIVIRYNTRGEFTYVSPSCRTLLGYEPEELIGQFGFHFIYADDIPYFQQLNRDLLANPHAVANVPGRFRHKAGHYLWLEFAGRVVKSVETGELVEAIVSARDVTQRKLAEASLRDSEARYRLLAENITDMVARYNADGEFLYVSPSCRTLLGYEPEELLGQSGLAFVHPADMPLVQQSCPAIFAEDQAVSTITCRYQHKAGHYLWLEFALRILRMPETGAVQELVVSARDITARQQADEALHHQRDFLQLVINSVPNFVAVKDRTGCFQLVNEKAAQLYGVTTSAMLGKTIADLHPNPADVALIQQQDQSLFASGQPMITPEMATLGRYFHTSRTPLRNADGQVDRVLIVSFDITEQKKAEATLQQALDKAQELGELKSRFISIASHEFRTPLAAIRATADTLLTYRRRLPDEQIDRRLGKILGQVDYLKSIIEDVLQLARLQARQVAFTSVPTDLDHLCRTLIEELHDQEIGPERVLYQVDDTVRTVILDPKLMRQIIVNLLSNALKYSPDNKLVALTLGKRDGVLVLQVRDEGIGIPAADLPYLYQPFHRASNVGAIAGTGLGLTIAKEFVELQGGTLCVTSEVGVGTTFTVCIPLDGKRE